MKFLCLNCNEGMQLESTSGPREGSLEAIFVCPDCSYKIVMLTNPWETQLVMTLGVTIGGRAAPASPYEQVLDNLVQPGSKARDSRDVEPPNTGCPFAAMLGEEEQTQSAARIRWTDEAKMRLERIPSFVRPMVQRAIERYAIEQGHQLITDGIMDEARSKLGM